MLTIPFKVSDLHYSIMVVFQDENLERIRAYDPAEISVPQIEQEMTLSHNLRLKDVIVTYANPADMEHLEELWRQDKGHEALRFLCRGWKYRPDAGDHDRGPERLAR